MPMYLFVVDGDVPQDEVSLPNDQAAWAQLVMLSGEILKDTDGRFPPNGDLKLVVNEGARQVGELRIIASRSAPPA